MRKSRDELAKDVDQMVALRNQNKTYKQIADIMGYKSAGHVHDLLKHRGHHSVILSKQDIQWLISLIPNVPLNNAIKTKLKKALK